MDYDVERYIAGSDEINRKREVITRVVSALVQYLYGEQGDRLKKRMHSFDVDLPGSRVGIMFHMGWYHSSLDFYEREPREYSAKVMREWWENGMPARVVPEVYDALPFIIESVAKVFKDDAIHKHFEFFQDQAPNN